MASKRRTPGGLDSVDLPRRDTAPPPGWLSSACTALLYITSTQHSTVVYFVRCDSDPNAVSQSLAQSSERVDRVGRVSAGGQISGCAKRAGRSGGCRLPLSADWSQAEDSASSPVNTTAHRVPGQAPFDASTRPRACARGGRPRTVLCKLYMYVLTDEQSARILDLAPKRQNGAHAAQTLCVCRDGISGHQSRRPASAFRMASHNTIYDGRDIAVAHGRIQMERLAQRL